MINLFLAVYFDKSRDHSDPSVLALNIRSVFCDDCLVSMLVFFILAVKLFGRQSAVTAVHEWLSVNVCVCVCVGYIVEAV